MIVKDNTNKVYTELSEHIKALYPTLKSGQTYSENVKLPYMYFTSFDGTTALSDLSNNEVARNVAYQIEVYSDTGLNFARKISNDIREYMIGQGYRCRAFLPLDSQDSKVSRFVSRYARLDV